MRFDPRLIIVTAAVTLGACLPASAQYPDPLLEEKPILSPQENTAASQQLPGEYIMWVGGPALKKWEELRVSHQIHDRWWANFVQGANIRTRQIVSQGVPPSSITWLVYRPAYITRGREEGKSLIGRITDLVQRRGVRLVWFSTKEEMLNYINAGNNRSRNRIASLDFFGHSNKHCYLLDYSNAVMGASRVFLHERELSRISRAAFHRNAFVKSWGCHTAESMSRKWKRAVGVPLWGALGKTDYVPTGRGQLPELSTAAGAWEM